MASGKRVVQSAGRGVVTQTPELEWGWWDGIADGPDLAANLYDESIGTAADCLAEIVPALDLAPGEPAAVLELGCGTGRLLGALAARRPMWLLTGVDISERIIDRARAREDLRNVALWVGDGRTIPERVPDGFDAVYSMGLFQHLPADACAGYVREVARVLRPGGRFRFQIVTRTEEAFLSHQHGASDVLDWCHADPDDILDIIDVDPGRLKSEWCWFTARKP